MIAFTEFTGKLVSKWHKIPRSADGIPIDFCNLSEAEAHVIELRKQFTIFTAHTWLPSRLTLPSSTGSY